MNKLNGLLKKILPVAIMALFGIFMFVYYHYASKHDFVKGKRQLEMQGYESIENTGYAFFCCSEEDSFSTGFKAIDKNGNWVEGCFCSGPLKGLTIRFR